jgi:PAS domain S-box-containing protein
MTTVFFVEKHSPIHVPANRNPVWFAWAILALLLFVTFAAWDYSSQHAQHKAEEEFKGQCDGITRLIHRRIAQQEEILSGCASLLSTYDIVSRSQWRDFIEAYFSREKTSAIAPIGFTPRISHDSKLRHIQLVRSEGFRKYEVWPGGEREEYFPIVYVEPRLPRTTGWLGYDLLSDPERAMRLKASMVSGAPLVIPRWQGDSVSQDRVQTFLLCLPVYKGSASKDTTDKRMESFIGFIFSPLRMQDLAQGAIASTNLQLEVFDGNSTTPANLIYRSEAPASTFTDRIRPCSHETRLRIGGGKWTFKFSKPIVTQSSEPLFVIAGGGAISLFVFGFLRTAIKRRSEAVEARERFEQVLSSISDAFLVVDRDWNLSYLNERAAQLLRGKRVELVGKHLWSLLPGVQTNFGYQKLIDAMANRTPVSFETFYPPFDLWVECRSYPSREGLAVYVADITSRKKSEELIRRNENQLRMLTNALPGLVDYVDQDGRYRFVNEQYENWFGKPKTWFEGKHLKEVLGETAFERIQPYVDRALSGQAITYEESIPYENGGARFVRASYMPDLSDSGKVRGFYSMVIDISETRRNQEALREAERRFRRLATQAPVGIFMTDASGRCIFVNHMWSSLTGLQMDQAIGDGWLQAIHPDDRAQVRANWKETVQENKEFSSELRVTPHAPGQDIWIRFSVRPVKNSLGEVTSFIATVTDISELKSAERKVRKWNSELENRVAKRTEELQSAYQDLESFTYSVSHDLRAPLRAMNGFAHILVENHSHKLDPEATHLLRMISTNSRRMGNLIDDLLAFSRLSRQSINRRTFHPHEIAEQALEELSVQNSLKDIEIQLDTMPLASGDPVLLKQVFINLVSNGLKFSRDRKPAKIHIGSFFKDQERVYFVRDNGVGFDMSYAHRIFGVFEKLHSNERYEGTGVGLAIVENIVKRHGGRVWAESQPDCGACFFFTLGESDLLGAASSEDSPSPQERTSGNTSENENAAASVAGSPS